MAERRVGRPWSAREDQLLASAVAVHGQVDNWKAVALSVPGRTNKACRKRWLHSLSPNVKKTAWTKEEDNLLLELYRVHSAKWAIIARNIPGRTDDACSKRYREALDPSLKKDEWTPQEDEKLIAAYHRLGGKWGQVGQELQRSGLGCRNRWRLLERKRTTVPLGDPGSTATASKTTLNTSTIPLGPTPDHCNPPTWPSLPMMEPSSYWDESLSQVDALPSGPPSRLGRSRNPDGLLGDPPSAVQHALVPQLVNYAPPFHYSSSSLSSALSSPQHAARYEKDAEATACNGRQSQVPPTTSAPPDSTSIHVFAPFDYESASSTSTVSAGPTSPAPQAAYTHDMHPSDSYNDCTNQFHQLHQSVPHTAIPIHMPSPVHSVHVDHYTATVGGHEGCSHSHNALTTGIQSTLQSSSLRALPSSAEAYFANSQLPGQQGGRIPSSMSSSLLLERSSPYHHTSPQPQLDVNAQHALLHTTDPLLLSESRSGYHCAHPRDASRARGVEIAHGEEQRGEYHRSRVESSQGRHVHPLSRPPTTSPPEPPYVLQQYEHHNPGSATPPEPGPSRVAHDLHYAGNQIGASQLVQRPVAVSRTTGTPYTKRHMLPLDGSIASSVSSPSQSVSRQRPTSSVPRKRPDAQAPLRLSSDLPATLDPSVKPYACGHESCWPSNTASSRACFRTSRGLSDHNKAAHPDDSGGDRPYRCGLEGCGKSWKSINGLQYHLQISKAHFQQAITSTYAVAYMSGLTVPASVEASTSNEGEEKAKKQYKCPYENCPNRYKQLSGLRYHLAHGHPAEIPKQLDLVPPALSRKLEEKMRLQGSAPPLSDLQSAADAPTMSSHATQRTTSNP